MHRRFSVSIALTIAIGGPLAAQSVHWTSLDVTLGAGYGWGGKYFDRAALAGELSVVRGHHSARIVAFTVGGRATLAGGDICRTESGPGSRCLPRFPAIAHVALLGGLEQIIPGGALRAMAGPAFYAGEGASGLGGQLQFDGAVGFAHLKFVTVARGSLIARVNGERLRLGSLAIGLRAQ